MYLVKLLYVFSYTIHTTHIKIFGRGGYVKELVYIRLRYRVQVHERKKIYLGEIAKLIGPKQIIERMQSIQMYEITKSDHNIIIIDYVQVIERVLTEVSDLELQGVGPTQTIIEVLPKQKKVHFALFVIVWMLLFVGAALTIMNFHEDVSMRSVHQKLYTIITGQYVNKPLILQIPYSIGLGLGMVLFFNHFFKKRFNEEPSPLEVEMFNYQQDLDRYVMVNENKESMINIDDDSDSNN